MFGVGLFGSAYLVPLFVQTVQGYTPFVAGLLLMPAGLVMGLFMPIGGYMSDRIPARWLDHLRPAVFRRVVVLARAGGRQQRLLDGRVVPWCSRASGSR